MTTTQQAPPPVPHGSAAATEQADRNTLARVAGAVLLGSALE